MDLEWNQASVKAKEQKGIMFEILEIGAVKVRRTDKGYEIVDTFSSYVRPQVYKRMHNMTKKIVHFDFKKLMNEESFCQVIERFLDWCGEDYSFCIWGTSDISVLQSNLLYYSMDPISDGPCLYYDVQKLFSIRYEDTKSRRSLQAAADMLDIKAKGEFHDALSDAYYTAEIFIRTADEHIIKYHSYDNFYLPENKSKEIHVKFPGYSKYISRVFKNKHRAMNDKEVSSLTCNICDCRLNRLIKWFSYNGGKFYLAIGLCPEHGYIKAKARMKKAPGDEVYVVKTVRPITEDEYEHYKKRFENKKD